jgi:hypothetical protein
MKIKKNWWLWGIIFICFIVVWASRTSYLTYRLSVERAKSKYELEIKKGVPPLGAPVASPKQATDVWGLVIKISTALAALKTLLDIIDKLRSKSQKNVIVPVTVPAVLEGSKVTITIVIEQVRKLATQFLMYPFRFLRR